MTGVSSEICRAPPEDQREDELSWMVNLCSVFYPEESKILRARIISPVYRIYAQESAAETITIYKERRQWASRLSVPESGAREFFPTKSTSNHKIAALFLNLTLSLLLLEGGASHTK